MSYDLYLLRVPQGAETAEVYRRCLQEQEEELNPGPVIADLEREKLRLAKWLIQFDTSLQIAEFDFDNLARIQNIPPEEVRRRYRHLELNRDDYTGIQITLWDRHAELSFPYWHSGEQSAAVLRKVWEAVEILQIQGGFSTFDPQLGQVLDLTRDFARVLAGYAGDNAS